MQKKPVLSIGIIFKNEIRCLERCLKSLQPLRDLIPCELVMADTGSYDGSREVAERYADLLIDFPWIDDFSAARNAVMDRCSGEWYFSIDADEWLGGEISELADFVKSERTIDSNVANLIIYNYLTPELDENYSEFRVYRLFRLSTGLRFEGAIHERWPYEKSGVSNVYQLSRAILYHDGYVNLCEEEGKAKRERNLSLLRRELARDPNHLRTLTQYLESSRKEPDYLDQLRRAMDLVRSRCPRWQAYGPSIFRYAVLKAKEENLPELKGWIKEAKELFPDSLFTRIDVEYINFVQAWDEKDYRQGIPAGERCLAAMMDLKAGRDPQDDLAYSTVLMQGAHWEQELKTFLAEAYLREQMPQKCRSFLEDLDYKYLNRVQTKHMTHTMIDLHIESTIDTAPLVRAAWEGIREPVPDQERADIRKRAFLLEASSTFTSPGIGEWRPAYTLFAPLADMCELGRAAAVLAEDRPSVMAEKLHEVENWAEFPVQALAHALEYGVQFPPPGRTLGLEEMDGLASRLSEDKTHFLPLVRRAAAKAGEDRQSLAWARGLAIAAMYVYDWTAEDVDIEQGLALVRVFAEIEKEFLPFCYAPEALCGQNLFTLPPVHRFGWYCIQAFDSLDGGDASGYVRALRMGLDTCKDMKNLVEFLTEHTPELRTLSSATPELLQLAEQVRILLAQYPADDPAVIALKQSAAYQTVAHLIEGPEVSALL